MDTALSIYNQFDQLQRAALALYKSQYFTDAKSEAQAIVKVMAGAELGIPPFASMTGIHIIQGKPALGANVIATLIKNDPRYNYRVLEMSDTVCRIQFYESGEPCGVSEFTATDARKAGTKNMDKFPKNMLFARAISNGAKWYTPGIFGGAPVYTPDELGADVDEDGNIVEGSYTPNEPTKRQPEPAAVTPAPKMQAPAPANVGGPSRDAEAVKVALIAASMSGSPNSAGEKQLKFTRASLSSLTGDNHADASAIIRYVFGVDSSTKLTGGQASALIDWAGAGKDNGYKVNPTSVIEARGIVNAQLVADGQGSLFDDEPNGAYAE